MRKHCHAMQEDILEFFWGSTRQAITEAKGIISLGYIYRGPHQTWLNLHANYALGGIKVKQNFQRPKVCAPIVATSNSMCNVPCWVMLWLEIAIMDIASSFTIIVIRDQTKVYFCCKWYTYIIWVVFIIEPNMVNKHCAHILIQSHNSCLLGDC